MQSVLDRLSRRDAFSQARESYLGKLANLFVTADVDVRFGDLPAPADCRDEDGKFIVRIDQTEFSTLCQDQSKYKDEVTPSSLKGVSDGYMDAFLQEGLLYHELGHVLFSDFDALSDVCSNVPMSERNVLKNLINAYEDAVIEIFLRQVYDCGDQLLIKNQVYHNLFHEDQVMWETPTAVEPMSQAELVAFELGRVDTGVLNEFDSHAKQEGLDAFYDVIQMPTARDRYHRLLELFEELKDETDMGDAEQETDQAQQGEADQSGRQDGQQTEAPQIDLSPDESEEEDEEDEEESGGGSAEDEEEEEESEDEDSGAGSQSGDEEDEEGEDQSSGGSDSDEDEDDEQGQSDQGGDDEDEEDEEIPSVGNVEDQIDQEDVDDLVDDTEVNPDQDDDEVETIEAEVNGAAGTGGGRISTPDPKEFEAEREIIRRAEQRSRYLKRVVEDHFEPTKGNAVNRDRTHGNFDSTRMIQASRGSPRCFKTEDNPDTPDFQVVIAVDASGSMSGDGMPEAAEAATMAAKAFEDAGGDVYAYRFGLGVELVKTPSMRYDESKNALSSLDTTSATELLPILEKYQELSQGVSNSFLFVITDGMPANDEVCKKELRKIEDPTACLQYDEYGRGFGDDYDAFQVIKNSDDIQQKSTSLIRRLVEQGGASL